MMKPGRPKAFFQGIENGIVEVEAVRLQMRLKLLSLYINLSEASSPGQ